MKKLLLPLITLFILTSCTKTKVNPQPGAAPPEEVAGSWMYGSFAMTEFWSYNGSYQGNAFELSVSFKFHKDGTYEKYTVVGSRVIIGCPTNSFAYEKGTVSFDKNNQSFTTQATLAKYRIFSCSGKKEGEMPKKDLKPGFYKWKSEGTGNNRKLLIDASNTGERYTEFYYKNW